MVVINKVYAGIGSRETPPFILKQMTQIAVELEKIGFILYSGGAEGADLAFEKNVTNKQVFRPRDVENDPAAFELAGRFHPAWKRLGNYAKLLHARNGYIVLGVDLESPVDFIVCWTPGGKVTGGTGQALRIAAG